MLTGLRRALGAFVCACGLFTFVTCLQPTQGLLGLGFAALGLLIALDYD